MSKSECQRFLINPLKYVRDVCINLQTPSGKRSLSDFDANNCHEHCWFDLVPWSTSLFSFGGASQVILEPTTKRGDDLITGYYVPYISYGVVKNHIDEPVLLKGVPEKMPPRSFVFTGGQNGCSLLMMKGTEPNTVDFMHYPNSDGKESGYPLLERVKPTAKTAEDIILSIDFDDYGEKYNPNACSFFYHDGKEWVAVTQPQVQGAVDMERKRCSMSINKNKRPRYLKKNSEALSWVEI